LDNHQTSTGFGIGILFIFLLKSRNSVSLIVAPVDSFRQLGLGFVKLTVFKISQSLTALRARSF
jgi:hypothetical protein